MGCQSVLGLGFPSDGQLTLADLAGSPLGTTALLTMFQGIGTIIMVKCRAFYALPHLI